MKKKAIATLLIGSMLLMPLPVFADEKDNYLHTLQFGKIKIEMEKKSPLISSMWEMLPDTSEIDSTIKELRNSIGTMTMQLDGANQAAKSYGDLAESLPNSDPQKQYYAMMSAAYGATAANLTAAITSLQMTLKTLESQTENIWKSYIQIEQTRDQTIQGVEKIYLGYFSLKQSRDELDSNIELLESKLKVAKLQESLGMTTSLSTLETENQIQEMRVTLQSLDKSLQNLIGNINIILGQDYDTELDLQTPPVITGSMLDAMNYNEDLKTVLDKSYDVRLAEEYDEVKQAKKEVTFAFYQVYQNVLDKQKALEMAEEKLGLEQKKYDQYSLMYSLGLTSKIEFDALTSSYLSQVRALEAAKLDLLQAYTDYEWMKKGLKVSVSSSTSGASTSAKASSSASSMSSSSMSSSAPYASSTGF